MTKYFVPACLARGGQSFGLLPRVYDADFHEGLWHMVALLARNGQLPMRRIGVRGSDRFALSFTALMFQFLVGAISDYLIILREHSAVHIGYHWQRAITATRFGVG